MQAQLDSFSSTLATRFNDQGVKLFTDASGDVPGSSTTAVPPDGIVGFSSTIQVGAAIAADPSSLSEDGSTDTALALLQTTLGSDSPAAPGSGLGVDGNISTGYSGTSAQAQVASTVSASLTTATSVQSSLTTKVSNVSGVNVDNEMSNIIALQNAYTANAKIVTAVKDMFTALLDAV